MGASNLLHLFIFGAAILSCKPRSASSSLRSSADTVNVRIGDQNITVGHLKSQGWPRNVRERFYFADQGSMFIPYKFFMHLNAQDGSLFRSDKNLARYGFLPYNVADLSSGLNPDGLPIGFVKHVEKTRKNYMKQATNEWLGVTCAACHSQRVEFPGSGGSKPSVVMIDGGTSLSNHMLFMYDLRRALEATLRDPKELSSFASRLQGGRASEDNIKETKNALEGFLGLEGDVNFRSRVSRSLPVRAETLAHDVAARSINSGVGPGRLDAFGNILNEVTVRLTPQEAWSLPSGPVSYPQLWDSARMEFVQWNGAASSPLVRNIGQVLGVYGDFWINTAEGLRNKFLGWAIGNVVPFDSTVMFGSSYEWGDGILWIERALRGSSDNHSGGLKAPSWAELAEQGAVPPIDIALATAGKDVYDNTCSGCHVVAGPVEMYPSAWTSGEMRVPLPNGKESVVGVEKFGKVNLVSLFPLTAENRKFEQLSKPCRGECKTRSEIRDHDVYTVQFNGESVDLEVNDADSVVSGPIGTDETFLKNLVSRKATLDPSNAKQNSLLKKLRANPRAASSITGESTVPQALLLKVVTNQIMSRHYVEKGATLNPDGSLNFAGNPALYKEFLEDINRVDPNKLPPLLPPLAYRARNLAGIWATAPFLHNGSVPNLREMLKSPRDRVKRFRVGSPKYDVKNMGFVTEPTDNDFSVEFDTTLPSNSNQGHEFGTDLSELEKEQLLEYLKTLTSDGESPNLSKGNL